VEHEEAATRQLIHDEKWPVVADTYHLLGVSPQRFQQVGIMSQLTIRVVLASMAPGAVLLAPRGPH
jgi:hypothetical protein